MWGMFSWLQSAISPLIATKSYTLDFKVTFSLYNSFGTSDLKVIKSFGSPIYIHEFIKCLSLTLWCIGMEACCGNSLFILMCVPVKLRCLLVSCVCVSMCVCARMYSVCVTETPVMMYAHFCLLMAPKWLSVWSSTSPVGESEGSNAEQEWYHSDTVHLDRTLWLSMCWSLPAAKHSHKHAAYCIIVTLNVTVFKLILTSCTQNAQFFQRATFICKDTLVVTFTCFR